MRNGRLRKWRLRGCVQRGGVIREWTSLLTWVGDEDGQTTSLILEGSGSLGRSCEAGTYVCGSPDVDGRNRGRRIDISK